MEHRAGSRGFFSLDNESLENIIKTVVREHHFSPVEIDAFFLDEQDYHGLTYWYNDCKEMNEELKPKKTGNKK